ncbi:MAG: plastocyanin/azurin family copper-binding protein, partial [Halobacteria archaeon]|nr:plastocyanin/azurin family copper-binding protein [Halobacteria archaeon]
VGVETACAKGYRTGNTTEAVSGNETGNESGSGGSSREPKTWEVSMTSENIFDPIGLHIQPGDTVKWVNNGGVHSSHSYDDRIPEGASTWASGTYSEGESWSHTFETEGTYDYYCTPHKSLGMVGRIVVGKPGGPAEQSPIPNKPPEGKVPSGKTIAQNGPKLSYPFTGVSSGNGGGGSVVRIPSGVKALVWGLFGALGATLFGSYLSLRYDRDMGSAKAAGILGTLLGFVLIIAITFRLLMGS